MANSCKDCKHDKGKCVGVSRSGSHLYCFEQKETTNAERIRAMSDEELADVVVCPHTGKWDLCRDDCKKCRLEWLKQPVEVDNG